MSSGPEIVEAGERLISSAVDFARGYDESGTVDGEFLGGHLRASLNVLQAVYAAECPLPDEAPENDPEA